MNCCGLVEIASQTERDRKTSGRERNVGNKGSDKLMVKTVPQAQNITDGDAWLQALKNSQFTTFHKGLLVPI